MKLSRKMAALATAAVLSVGGIATAANATEPSPSTGPTVGTVDLSYFCQEGTGYLSFTSSLSDADLHLVSATLFVNDDVDPVRDGPADEVRAGLGQNPLALNVGDVLELDLYNGTYLIDADTVTVTSCEVTPPPPTNGTVTSVVELTCDMVSTPAPEGSAKVVYTDIDGKAYAIVIGGLTAGVNSGVLDDGSEDGLALDITIAACQEPTTPPVVTPPVVTPTTPATPATPDVIKTPVVVKSVTQPVPSAVHTD